MCDPVLGPVERYYSAKVAEYGAVPAGADWNSAESQELRFRELLRICQPNGPFSINDIGCGYGALVLVLRAQNQDFVYRGFDISSAMVAQARETLGETDRWSFTDRQDELVPVDYSVASGIFNVKLDAKDDDWGRYVSETLDWLDSLSTRGFSFNMLTSYSDPDRMRSDLYYANPGDVFDQCKQRYSRHIALLHDYGLWEFTMLVRKDPLP
ncbi:MAG: class I SAM-dependent methyltransferase [Gaiellaceae bacterium]